MTAYYNENDPFTAAWLRVLIAGGHIAPGDVDERSIEDVRPSDLDGYAQCHFFAGIGGWSYALRLAGWPDDRPVWTGSCPCQPFSVAGARRGVDDERHLWPHWRWLIAQCGPAIVFGEQVASRDGRKWLSGVRVDLEALDYGVGAVDLCAAGVKAPHIRQRLYRVADANGGEQRDGHIQSGRQHGLQSQDCCVVSRMANSECVGQQRQEQTETISDRNRKNKRIPQRDSHPGRMGDSDILGPQRWDSTDQWTPWSASVAIPCADGYQRRIEPGSFPLAHGYPIEWDYCGGTATLLCRKLPRRLSKR